MSWHTTSTAHEGQHTAGLALALVEQLLDTRYAMRSSQAATHAAAALCILPGRVQDHIAGESWSDDERTKAAALLVAEAIEWNESPGANPGGDDFAAMDTRVRQVITAALLDIAENAILPPADDDVRPIADAA